MDESLPLRCIDKDVWEKGGLVVGWGFERDLKKDGFESTMYEEVLACSCDEMVERLGGK